MTATMKKKTVLIKQLNKIESVKITYQTGQFVGISFNLIDKPKIVELIGNKYLFTYHTQDGLTTGSILVK